MFRRDLASVAFSILAARVEAIVAAVEPLLDAPGSARCRQLDGYVRLRAALGDPGVTRRAAATILDQVLATMPSPSPLHGCP